MAQERRLCHYLGEICSFSSDLVSELNIKQRADGVFFVDAGDGLTKKRCHRQLHDFIHLPGIVLQRNGVADHETS